ncbi:toll-like receptor 4 [Ostrea edulis]|uniref:toll-like receptor 4 n=1 Tax=Ostrea edulis TaxID=37623 RepID=UPI0024AE8DC6|nr:toll-like receptor 4 [Ostrea edulis]
MHKMLYLFLWVFIFGLYQVESVSELKRACKFGNVKCICWHQYHGFHVNCSGRNVKSIPGFNDSVVWLDLSRNKITNIPPMILPKHLTSLDLSWNNMKNVRKEFFSSVPELNFLDLSYCNIHDIEEGSFGDLDNLRHLHISFNRNLGFASLPNLTFHLEKTRISSLHLNGITCMTGVGTTLRLHHLRNIRGTNITELSLDSNRLEIFEPGVIGWLPKTLEVFSMANNKLTAGIYLLEFASMTNLRIMNASFQRYPPKYPDSVFDRCQDKLERQFYDAAHDSTNNMPENHIDYDNDSYLSFNWTILLPPNLETYDFHSSGLYFHVINFSVYAPNLRHVYLQNNFIMSWTGHIQMKNSNILAFDMSNNFCSHVSPQSLQDFKHVKYLNISHNDLGQDLEKDTTGQLFKHLVNLEVLDLSFNKISSLPRLLLGNSKRIKYINVSNNRLSDWEVSVSGKLLVQNKWKIRYIVYKSKQKFGWVKQPSIHGSTRVNYEHDVFLSYSGCTLMFVLNEVIPHLEGNRNMKLIIRDRDYLPGFLKTDNIMYSIQESRKTVCIVSRKYLESRWRDYELNMAKIEGIVDRGRLDFVILVLLPEVYNSGYPQKMMDLVKRNCYVEYPDESCAYDDFWEKLTDMIES